MLYVNPQYNTSSPGGGIGGTINTGQIAFASALDTIAGTNNLKWDDANSKIDLTGMLNILASSEYVLDFGVQLVGNTAVVWMPIKGLVFKHGATGLPGNRIVITQTGSVGIGSFPPSYKLDVNGDFRCVNDANFNLNAFIGGYTSFTSSSEHNLDFGQQLVGNTGVQWIPPSGLMFKHGSTGPAGSRNGMLANGNFGLGTETPAAKLQVNGSQAVKRVDSPAGPYAATSSDYVISKTGVSVGGDAVTLPAAASLPSGQVMFIKDKSGVSTGRNITVTANLGDTIDSAPVYTIASNFGSVMLMCDGVSNWEILASH